MARNLIIRDGKPQKPLMVVTTVLDASGSMISLKKDAINGYNQYLDECKEKIKDNNIYFGLLKFNSIIGNQIVHEHTLLSKVNKMTKDDYDPKGSTPLYDAIWAGLDITEKFIDNKNANVLFLIITDGQENYSRDHTLQEIKDRIKEKENIGWTFRFVGIEELAEVQASDLGIRSVHTVAYQHTPQGWGNMYNALRSETICWRDNTLESRTDSDA